jgi:hypothetical protein
MTKALLGSFAVLAGMAMSAAAGEPAPTELPAAAPTAAGAAAPPGAAAPSATPLVEGTQPWSPPAGHANVWPYAEPWHPGNPDCGPPGEFWLSAEYWLWGIKGGPSPVLVTAGPAATAGVVGAPGAAVLFGGSRLDTDVFQGGRFTAGVWCNDDHTLGYEGTYFFLAERSVKFTGFGSGDADSAALARPFVNALTGLPDFEVVAAPGFASGIVQVRAPTSFQGAEGNGVWQVYCGPSARVELLAGFRWQDLSEQIIITEQRAILPGAGALAGTRVTSLDEFDTGNRYFGGQIGARAEFYWGHFIAAAHAKLAMGGVWQLITVGGGTRTTAPGGMPATVAGGLLTQPSNIRDAQDGTFAVVPEVGVQLSYLVRTNVRAFVGYTFIYWSDVVRPGDLIDTTVNPLQIGTGAAPIAGPVRPAFSVRDTDFWAQGFNVGVEVRY